ncbi:GxxExxY protein [Pendulispora rubella]|uniref:GxxExxY protein n=1 Tax=Pendulispora rubella TaxID=2741070 RepID=A0ABZ2LEL6_9BACT
MNRQDARDARDVRKEPAAEIDGVASMVIAAAIEVHTNLGLGFVESVYERALGIELRLRGIPFVAQAAFAVSYKGNLVGEARLDLLVADRLVVELKAVDAFNAVHAAQTLSYLKATRLPLALLINFNVPVLLRGVRRVVLTNH